MVRRKEVNSRQDGVLSHSSVTIQRASSLVAESFAANKGLLLELEGQGGRFAQLSEKLVNSATGREGGFDVFLGAMNSVQAPVDFLFRSHAQTCELLTRLAEASGRIQAFIDAQAEIQRTIAPLKYIQTLFKIESATLGGDVQGLFFALTTDIERLHNQVCEVFTAKSLELLEIKRTVDQVTLELEVQTRQLWKIVAAEKETIEKALEKLRQQLAESQSREPRLSGLGREIKRQIQAIATGLELQEGLSGRLLRAGELPLDLGEHDDVPAVISNAGQTTSVPATQVLSLRKDLTGAVRGIKGSLEMMTSHLAEAESQSLSMGEFQQLTSSADGMVQVLLDIFTALRTQIAVSLANTSAALEKLRPIGGLASDLNSVVRGLSHRIHLIGLNAQVQAAHVKQGVGLEALSAQTSEISFATIKISENIARDLDLLVTGLTGSVKALESLHSDTLQVQASIADHERTGERQLHSLRDEILSDLANLGGVIEAIRSLTVEMSHNVDAIEEVDAPLADLERQLLSVAKAELPTGKLAYQRVGAMLPEGSADESWNPGNGVRVDTVNDQDPQSVTAGKSIVVGSGESAS